MGRVPDERSILVKRVVAAAILLVLFVTGCSAKPAPTSGPVVIDITISAAGVTPSGANVDVRDGQTVTLKITSSKKDTVHVHGYDIEVEVEAGVPKQQSFTADKVGRFEIESHPGSGTTFVAEVPLT